MSIAVGSQLSTKYTLTGPNGAVAVFSENSAETNWVGGITELTGLDSPEVRENAENISGFDGGIHGPFYYGRRPITITGECFNAVSVQDRNEKLGKLAQACDAMRADATLEWTPDGGEAVFLKVRRAQPLRITGEWVKKFQLQLVAADPRIYSVKEEQKEIAIKEPGGLATEPKPQGIATAGKYVYVVSEEANKILVYEQDATGSLSLKESKAVGTKPWGIALSKDVKNVYVTNLGSNTITSFTRDTTTGALTVLGGTVATGTEPTGICVSANGKSAYCSNYGGNTISVFKRSGTGALTAQQTTTAIANSKPVGMAAYHFDEFVLVAHNGLSNLATFTRNTTTGELTFSSNQTVGTAPWGVFIGPAYLEGETRFPVVVTNSGSSNFTYIPHSTEGISTVAVTAEPHGACWSSDGKYFYVASSVGSVISQFTQSRFSAPQPMGTANIKAENPGWIAVLGKYLYTTNITHNTIGEYIIAPTGGLTHKGVLTPFLCENKGNAETFPILLVEPTGGYITGLTAFTNTTNQNASLRLKLNIYQNLELDTLNRTAFLGDGTNVYAALQFSDSTWWGLMAGVNEILTTPEENGLHEPVVLKVQWRNAWI